MVTRPASRSCPSTTGTETKSYFCRIRATSSWGISSGTETTGRSMMSATAASGRASTRLLSGRMPVTRRSTFTTKTSWTSGTSSWARRIKPMACSTVAYWGTDTYSVCMMPPAVSGGWSSRSPISAANSDGISARTVGARSSGKVSSRSAASSVSSSSTSSASSRSERVTTSSSRTAGETRLNTAEAASRGSRRNTRCRTRGSSSWSSNSAMSAG